MRGCFPVRKLKDAAARVLPAYAGMFPPEKHDLLNRLGSPRVCGDVSCNAPFHRIPCVFSPRMRGCFQSFPLADDRFSVLPAYAGMFPGGSSWMN